MIWDRVFKNGSSKICGKQPLKNLKGYGLLKAVFHNFYLVHSWILCLIYSSPTWSSNTLLPKETDELIDFKLQILIMYKKILDTMF